jgi:hypothetical protein
VSDRESPEPWRTIPGSASILLAGLPGVEQPANLCALASLTLPYENLKLFCDHLGQNVSADSPPHGRSHRPEQPPRRSMGTFLDSPRAKFPMTADYIVVGRSHAAPLAADLCAVPFEHRSKPHTLDQECPLARSSMIFLQSTGTFGLPM